MNTVNGFLEALKYLLPSLVVFLTTWYMVSRYFNSEDVHMIISIAATEKSITLIHQFNGLLTELVCSMHIANDCGMITYKPENILGLKFYSIEKL